MKIRRLKKRAGRFGKFVFRRTKKYAPFIARALVKRYFGFDFKDLKELSKKS